MVAVDKGPHIQTGVRGCPEEFVLELHLAPVAVVGIQIAIGGFKIYIEDLGIDQKTKRQVCIIF